MKQISANITGSLIINGVDVTDTLGSSSFWSGSFSTRVSNLESFSGSINSYTASNNTNISNLNATTASLNSYTASNDINIGNINSTTASLNLASGSAITRLNAIEVVTGSNISRLNSIESTTGSLNAASGSAITRLNALEVTSGSNITRISALELASGSAISRLNSIESKTGSYATTGSNTFVDTQYVSASNNAVGFTSTASFYTDGGLRVAKDAYISGTLYLNNVTVYGTQSVAYITSSQLNISTNLITVNTDTPSVRFGGLAVYDSGSTGLTGSILWDSENNHWVYSNPSGSSYSGGMFIAGPRSAALGSEVGTTACAIMMGQGGDHITSSAIFHYGNATCFYGTSFISSTGSVCFQSSALIGGNLSVGNTSTTSSITLTGTPIGGFTAGNIYWGKGNQTTAGIHIDSPGTNFEITTGYNESVTLSTGTGLRIYTNNGGGIYTSRMLLNRDGVTCFACQVCSPAFVLANGNCIIALRSTGGAAIGVLGFAAGSDTLNIKGGNSGGALSIRFEDTANPMGGFYNSNFGVGTLAAAYRIDAFCCSSATNTVTPVLRLAHVTSGTAATGLGAGISFFSQRPSSAVNLERAAIYGISGANPDDDGDLAFYTRTDTGAIGVSEKMRITSDGYVGIGCTTPSYRLDVNGCGRFITSGNNYILDLSNSSANQYGTIALRGTNRSGELDFFDGTTITAAIWSNNCAAKNLIFATNGYVEALRINANATYTLTNTTYSETSDQNTITFNQTYPTPANIAQIAVKTDGYFYNGAFSFRTADQFNANLLVERLRISSLGVACFSSVVCAANFSTRGTYAGIYCNVPTACSGYVQYDMVNTANGNLYQVYVTTNPNPGGSSTYMDYYYGKIIIGNGYDGANLKTYLTYCPESILPRSLYGSGGGNVAVCVCLVQGGNEYTCVNTDSSYCVRIKIAGNGNYTAVNLVKLL